MKLKYLLLVALLGVASFAQTLTPVPPAGAFASGAVVPITLQKAGLPTSAGLQFQVAAGQGVASLAVALDPSVQGKTLTCQGALNVTCVIFGFNRTTIADGPVAVVTATLSTPAVGPVAVTFSNAVVGDAAGGNLPVTIANPIVSLSIQDVRDVDGDGTVTAADQTAVVTAILSGVTTPADDVNKDGVVNVLDALVIATAAP